MCYNIIKYNNNKQLNIDIRFIYFVTVSEAEYVLKIVQLHYLNLKAST